VGVFEGVGELGMGSGGFVREMSLTGILRYGSV